MFLKPIQSSHANFILHRPTETGLGHHLLILMCWTGRSHHMLIWFSTVISDSQLTQHVGYAATSCFCMFLKPVSSSHVNLIFHRPSATGPSHHTKPFVSPTLLHRWPHLDLWGHWGQTSRDLRVLVLLFTSTWQPQWRHRVRLRQQQFTDDVDGWWWRHHVFLYSCVEESDVILHTEWLHHLHCLLWVLYIYIL